MEMNTPNQQQTPPQLPVSNQTSNNIPSHPRSTIPLLLVAALLIFAVAGIGAYYLGARNNQSTPQPIQQTSYPSPTTLQPTPNIDETTNWKTYSNGHVTFKYPPDMDANEPEKDFIMIVSKETKVVLRGWHTRLPFQLT